MIKLSKFCSKCQTLTTDFYSDRYKQCTRCMVAEHVKERREVQELLNRNPPATTPTSPTQQKRFAHRTTARLKGLIVKEDKCFLCEADDTVVRLIGHHYDYFIPDKVVWLCDKCHRRIHFFLKKKSEIRKKRFSFAERIRLATSLCRVENR